MNRFKKTTIALLCVLITINNHTINGLVIALPQIMYAIGIVAKIAAHVILGKHASNLQPQQSFENLVASNQTHNLVGLSDRGAETTSLINGLQQQHIIDGIDCTVQPKSYPQIVLPHQITYSPSFHIISAPQTSQNTFSYTSTVVRSYNCTDFVSPEAISRILTNRNFCYVIENNPHMTRNYLLHHDAIVRLWIACAHHDFKIYFPARLELARLAHDTYIFGHADGTVTTTTLRLLKCYYDPDTQNLILNPNIDKAVSITAYGIRGLTKNIELQELAIKDGGEYIFQNYENALEEASTAHNSFSYLHQQELKSPGSIGYIFGDYFYRLFEEEYVHIHKNYWNDINRSFYIMFQEAVDGRFEHAHDFIKNLKNGLLKRQAIHTLKHLKKEAPYLHASEHPHTQYINKAEIVEKRNAVITQIKTNPALCTETLTGLNQIQTNLAYINSSNFHERIFSRTALLKLSRFALPFPQIDEKYKPILEALCDTKTGEIKTSDLNPAVDTLIFEFMQELHSNRTIASLKSSTTTLAPLAEFQQLQASVTTIFDNQATLNPTSHQRMSHLVNKCINNSLNNQVNTLCHYFSQGNYEKCTQLVETLKNHSSYQQLATIKKQLFSTVFDEFLIPKKYSLDPFWADVPHHEKAALINEKGVKTITQALEFRHETVKHLRKEFSIPTILENEPSVNKVLYTFVDSIQHKNGLAPLLDVIASQKYDNPIAYSAIFNEEGIAKCYANMPQLKDFVHSNHHSEAHVDRITNCINRAVSLSVPAHKNELKERTIRYLKHANVIESRLESKLFTNLAELQCKYLEGDLRYGLTAKFPDLLKLFPSEEITEERARAAENALNKFDPKLLELAEAAPAPGFLVTYLNEELKKGPRFVPKAEEAAETEEKKEDCKYCFCEEMALVQYKNDVAIFNNHPKVKELGLTLTTKIAHHVMHGHVDRKFKKITGCHHQHGPCFCYTVTKVKTFNCGVSIAKINCGSCLKPSTTLFPDHWTHSKIIEVILNSLEKKPLDIWEFQSQKNITLTTDYGFSIELQVKGHFVDTYFPQIKSLQG